MLRAYGRAAASSFGRLNLGRMGFATAADVRTVAVKELPERDGEVLIDVR